MLWPQSSFSSVSSLASLRGDRCCWSTLHPSRVFSLHRWESLLDNDLGQNIESFICSLCIRNCSINRFLIIVLRHVCRWWRKECVFSWLRHCSAVFGFSVFMLGWLLLCCITFRKPISQKLAKVQHNYLDWWIALQSTQKRYKDQTLMYLGFHRKVLATHDAEHNYNM